MSTINTKEDEKVESAPMTRLSALPEFALQDSMVQRHADKQGNVDIGGMATEAALTRRNYKMLVKAFIAAVFLIFLLVLSTFGVSLAAAILAKDTEVNSSTGVLMVKGASGDGSIVKTKEAVYERKISNVGDIPFRDLRRMKKLILNEGGGDTGVQFEVKGVSKSSDGRVILIVEGGTIMYDGDGIVDATGIAKTVLLSRLGMDWLDVADGDNFRRALEGTDNDVTLENEGDCTDVSGLNFPICAN
jgi:hypothetical protein